MLAGRLTTLPGAEAYQMREHNHQLQKLINILHFLHNCPAGIRKISAQDGVTHKLNCKLKMCLQFLFLNNSGNIYILYHGGNSSIFGTHIFLLQNRQCRKYDFHKIVAKICDPRPRRVSTSLLLPATTEPRHIHSSSGSLESKLG